MKYAKAKVEITFFGEGNHFMTESINPCPEYKGNGTYTGHGALMCESWDGTACNLIYDAKKGDYAKACTKIFK